MRLFERHRRGLRLTYEGSRFLQHSYNILKAVSTAKYALNQKHTNYTGELTIGVSTTIAAYFMPTLLAHFKKSFVGIELKIIESKRKNIEKMLLTKEIDIAIILTLNIGNTEEIKCKTLIKSPRNLWVHPSHKFLELEQVSLADVSKERFIQLTSDEAKTTHTLFWKKHKLTANTIFETESIEAMRSLVANGSGITILSDLVYRPYSLEGDRIELIPLVEQIPSMDVGIAWCKNTQLSKNTQVFIDYCKMEYLSGRRSFKNEIK